MFMGQATGLEPEKSRARACFACSGLCPAVGSACCFPFSFLPVLGGLGVSGFSRRATAVMEVLQVWCKATAMKPAAGPNGRWANIRTVLLLLREKM